MQRSWPIGFDDTSTLADDAEVSFDALFRQYERSICGFLARLTGDTARAQELAQETFIRAYRALLKGERWDNPRAWLYRVASRLAINEHRRRQLLEWLPLSGIEPDPAPSVENVVVEHIAIQTALNVLPLKYRIPLVLYAYEGCSVAQVAEALQLSVSAVKMRLSRARARFRQTYGQERKS
jgi:RNA polymerase sigma-70 factor (ECF subfamily)